MHPDRLIAALALPTDAMVDKRVPKKLLLEHGAPTSTDKRRIQEGIEELRWVAVLKPARDLHDLYTRWMASIAALEAAAITGRYAPAKSPEQTTVRETALCEYGQLERSIAALRAQAKKEKQINRRVDLNLEIQRLEGQRVELRDVLDKS